LRNLLGDAACNWSDIRSGAKSDYELQRSFNAASGLPRASVFAIRRGSVLRLEGKGIPKLREQLSKHTALGERTWEGYGRFVLDHYPLDEAVDDPASDPFEQLIVSSEPIGKREAVIRHAESYEKQLKQANLKLPSRSRLGQLLDAVRSLGDSATAEQLRKCLEPFEQATKKKSGQPWKVFFPDNDAEKDLRKKLPKHARDAQLFVETLISLSEYNDK